MRNLVRDIAETERLRIEMWRPDDGPLLVRLHDNEDVNRYLSRSPDAWSEQTAAMRLLGWIAGFNRDGATKFKVLRKSDRAFVGRAGFSRMESSEFELGYSMMRGHWGNGYATEAAQALIDWFFTNNMADHFVAFAHADNVASARVLEKLGMRFERDGDYMDMPFRFYRMDRKDVR